MYLRPDPLRTAIFWSRDQDHRILSTDKLSLKVSRDQDHPILSTDKLSLKVS
jgi:hypothetical protein